MNKGGENANEASSGECMFYNGSMAAQILATKLYIPTPRPKFVLRPRLMDRLSEGLQGKLILISAPAGFGKTTLLSEWIACSERPAAWLSLDEGDNDPVRFISYLIAALQTIKAGIGDSLMAALQSPQLPQVDTMLTALLNEISVLPEHFLLVLDDYHLIDAQPVDQSLVFLVEHQPPRMHLVIATREDPQLPLARLRARGELTELRAADLRFTPVEAAEFLTQVMGLSLPPEDIAALETRTEGWIAGLQLAALSMQGLSDAASFIQSFTGSHRFVLDYLIEEVLGRQPENIQSFLSRTSILDCLCGPLCDALLNSPSASGQETLEYLERANLFIVPLDQQRRWYRYHHLFAELLRQRLGQPHELSIHHLRASVWFETNDDLAKAFHHALAAGDFERAVRLAEAAWQGMERNFQTNAWIGWVKKLPDAIVCSRPRLCVQLGWAYSDAGELETSETYLQNAERALAGVMDQDESKSLEGNIALIRSSNAQNQGDLAETVKYAELSIQLAPENDIFLQAQAAITLGFIHWATGNVEDSLQAMHTWMEDMQNLGNQLFVVASAFAVADMQVILGHQVEAEKTLREAIQQAAALGQEAELVTAHHHLGLSLLAHERGDDKAAAEHMQIAAELGKNSTLVDWPYRWNMAQARLKESAREWDAALELFDKARRAYVKNPVPMLQPVEAHKTRVYLKQGRLDKAQAWAQEQDISTEGEVRYLDEYDHLTVARVRLAEGSFAGVNALLQRLLALGETQKRTGSVIEILLTQALVHQAQGYRSQALAALEHALTLAEPECYLRIFVDEGEPMRLLILVFRSMIEKQGDPGNHRLFAYANKLLAAFPQPMKATSQSKIADHKSEMVDPLTDRELEILRLIAEGYSNAEIGQRLYLALSTVKGHNLRIFNKLQVQNRTEAVARARELGLL
jgi:LuxR family transcriptional regulator, maltose regulon positive regulatory protein